MKDFKVMLAKPLDEKKLSFPCYVSSKLDGIRALYYKGQFYTRNKKPVHGCTHLQEQMAQLQEFHGTTFYFDGELLVPGKEFQEASGIIRSHRETPEVVFNVFDVPSFDDDFIGRYVYYTECLNQKPLTHIKPVPHAIVNSATEMHNAYKAERARGLEGIMVKTPRHFYQNKRTANWMKIKAIETSDVLCTGFFEGQGRLAGSLGGLLVDFDGITVRVGGGFSDRDRYLIWLNRPKYEGMICEVAYQEVTPDGSMRHPRFITWRTDL